MKLNKQCSCVLEIYDVVPGEFGCLLKKCTDQNIYMTCRKVFILCLS